MPFFVSGSDGDAIGAAPLNIGERQLDVPHRALELPKIDPLTFADVPSVNDRAIHGSNWTSTRGLNAGEWQGSNSARGPAVHQRQATRAGHSDSTPSADVEPCTQVPPDRRSLPRSRPSAVKVVGFNPREIVLGLV